MVSKLIVIRHGITEGNEKRWFYGKTDLPLLKRGRETLLEYKRAGVYPEIPDDALQVRHDVVLDLKGPAADDQGLGAAVNSLDRKSVV